MSERKTKGNEHYCNGDIEVIDVIADQGWMIDFCLGNIVKYACRAKHKGALLSDLWKIENYAIMLREHVTPKNLVPQIDSRLIPDWECQSEDCQGIKKEPYGYCATCLAKRIEKGQR